MLCCKENYAIVAIATTASQPPNWFYDPAKNFILPGFVSCAGCHPSWQSSSFPPEKLLCHSIEAILCLGSAGAAVLGEVAGPNAELI
eukprot:6199426-Pleurochrysis_carterae.AAC.2